MTQLHQHPRDKVQNRGPFRGHMSKVGRLLMLPVLLLTLVVAPTIEVGAATTVTFSGEELVGKPTNNSITINIVPDATIEYYYEYGMSQGGPYTDATSPVTAVGGQPHEVVITGLSENTRYYYRMVYDGDLDVNDGNNIVREEHTFHTQRAEGSTFVFTITSDSHAQFNSNHQQTMTNILNDQPDFNLDLGDTFMVDNTSETQNAVNAKYLAYREPMYFDRIGHSVPIFLSSGNHEEEEGWNLNDSPSRALLSIQARKSFYPTPIDQGPGGFYSGNTDPLALIDEVTYGDEYREDYYAWEWGDALFVVIDPFQYTMNLPYTPIAGEESDETVDGNQWSWTLGAQQFNWLKQTLENSDARYKFMFSHQMVGGIPDESVSGGAGYVRGGAGAAPYFEWGGRNADGTWGFDNQRPGWGGVPIHQLMVANGVSAYFHGHDHQFVYEVLDGIVYQEVPSPSMTSSGFSGIYSESDPFTIEMLPNSGHLRLTVTPTETTVEYVRSNQTGVSYTYEIEPNEGSTDPTITIAGVPLAEFSSEPGVPSAEQSYTVSGSNLVDDITITPPSDFEISETSGSGWTTSPLVLTQSGGEVPETDIFVRFNRATEGTSSGDIVHASTDATTQNVAVSGTAGSPGLAGEANGDDTVNSTDALVILSCDVGISSPYCPVVCSDVNEDGFTNSTDALIILSYDVGTSVPFPVGEPGCP